MVLTFHLKDVDWAGDVAQVIEHLPSKSKAPTPPQKKDVDWLAGLKNKIQLFAVYKKIYLMDKDQTDSIGIENDITSKQNPKASRRSCFHI
jgi:hypothetical protein